MKWVSNTSDPRQYGFTPEDEKESQEWLKGKIIGDPKQTDYYTAEELREIGVVGVYVVD